MRAFLTVPWGFKNHLAAPLALLMASLIATMAVVHLEQLHGQAAAVREFAEPPGTGASAARLAQESAWTRWLLTALCSGSIVAAAVTIARATRGISRPMAHLVEVAQDVTRGRPRRRASPEAAGDLRVLAEAFNQMMEARQQADERLQSVRDSLELKVSARTAELWRANSALRDESEQRARAEREFYQAQKMEALGKLAGSIAHDFNNLLTVIIGGAECAQKQLDPLHPAVSLLETVQQAAERAAGLTKPLLTFSRNQVEAVEIVAVNDAAEEAARMLRRLLGVNIELRLELGESLPAVKMNGNQLQQVLINLGVNARDAMAGMGVLTITTRVGAPPVEAAERPPDAAPERWIELIVQDTGAGMDAATKARIFEPFFTTKPAGKGTGLGLSTVFGIVKQCGGALEVQSAPGEGAAFHVFFPATMDVAPDAALEAGAPDASASSAPCEETLLLVDDEDEIRELATLTLEERGYRVLSASHAEAAILLGEAHRGEIRALITDVMMPGINGVQMAEMLSKIVPDLRVLFVSGHSNEAISGETLLTAHASYLQKPYRGEELVTKVRSILSRAETRPAEAAVDWLDLSLN